MSCILRVKVYNNSVIGEILPSAKPLYGLCLKKVIFNSKHLEVFQDIINITLENIVAETAIPHLYSACSHV